MTHADEMLRKAGYKRGGKLTAEERHALPKDDFALPGGRYPIPDKSHARNALARASQFADSGQRAQIKRRIRDKFPSIKVGDK